MPPEFVILKNESDQGHLYWAEACKKKRIPFKILDLTCYDWIAIIKENNYSCFLACPPGREARFKKLYDERIYILNKVLNKFVYPSYDEISLHENKRYLSFWLYSQNLPHPETKIFYFKDEGGLMCREVYHINNHDSIRRYYKISFDDDISETTVYENQIIGKIVNVIDNNIWNKISLEIWDSSINNLNAAALFTKQ